MNITVNSENTSVKNEETDFSAIGKNLKDCLTPESARSVARHFAPNDDGAARWAARTIQEQIDSAISLVDVSPAIRKRHDFQTVGELEKLLTGDDYHGVIVAFCPMGSGKTRHLGKPFAEWAAGKGRFVAIAPLTALVDGLAAEFKADHYRTITKAEVENCDRLAVCMPSIIKEEHSVIHGEADFIFIDEIAGCLSFLKSEQCGKCPEKVFHALVQRIKRAKCIMVADANISDRVMKFLEYCRPGERFRVIEQPKNPDGRKVEYYQGKDAKVSFVSDMLTRLSAGENLWIGAESPDMAKTITTLLQLRGLPVLGVWPGNKGNKAQAAFLKDPHAEIAKYRAIVHSPVIQSGVHVADDGKHISHVMWIGQGGKLAAPAVMQTLGRVRYGRTFTLALLQNNKQEVYSVDTMQSTILEASGADKVSLYDSFCAFQEQDYQWAVSHAHLAIVAVLRHAGWEVNHIGGVNDDKLGEELNSITEANAERWKQLVLSAPDISSDDAEALRRQQSRTEKENASLEAHRMRGYLGHVQGLSPDGLWDLWDDGRIVSKIRRFKIQQGKKLSDNDDAALFHRHFPDAQVRIYRKLGILGMKPGSRVRKSEWDAAIQNMTQDDWVMAAYLGIVQPSQVLRFKSNNKNEVALQAYTPPEERTFGLFKQIMERMGLEADSLRNSCPAEGEEKYTFIIQPVSFNLMSGVAKLSGSAVIPHIYIRDEALNCTKPDDEKQTEQSNTNHAKLLTEQSDEPSGMELLTEIAARFRGLKSSTRASVLVAGQEVIIPVPDCVAATAPREIMLDGLPVMWPWDYSISDELLEMVQSDGRSYAFQIGQNICLLRPRKGAGSPEEIIRALRAADTAA